MARKTGDLTRKRIQKKARELFLRRGYVETTIRDIAAAAKLTPGAIYVHYKGKRELFDSLNISEVEQLRPEYERKRTSILRAALTLFGEKGFEATTMEQIAFACGISKATLYIYCESKEDLLVQVLQESSFNTISRQAKSHPDNADWETVICEIGRSYMEIGKQKERVALLRTVIQESVKFPEIGKLYYERGYKTACDDVVNYLHKLRETGRVALKDVDITMAVQTYFATLQSYLLLNSVIAGIPRTNDPEEYLRLSTELFLSGLKRAEP